MFPEGATPIVHPSAYAEAQSQGFLGNITGLINQVTRSTSGSLGRLASGFANTSNALQAAFGLAKAVEGLTGVKTGTATLGKAIDATTRADRDLTHEANKYGTGLGATERHVPRHERPNQPSSRSRKRKRRRPGSPGGTRRDAGGGLEEGE